MPHPGCAPGEQLAKQERINNFRAVKDYLKARWLTLAEFNQAQRGELVTPGPQAEASDRVVSKNQIDRLTNTAGGTGGKLYDFTEFCLSAVDVYWRITDGYEELVKDFLADLYQTGYGKRKSVGYGQLASVPALEPFDGFTEVADANGFVTLSNFVPANRPHGRILDDGVKYGRLGKEAAASAPPFKRPLIQLEAGSCFYDVPMREWYGPTGSQHRG